MKILGSRIANKYPEPPYDIEATSTLISGIDFPPNTPIEITVLSAGGGGGGSTYNPDAGVDWYAAGGGGGGGGCLTYSSTGLALGIEVDIFLGWRGAGGGGTNNANPSNVGDGTDGANSTITVNSVLELTIPGGKGGTGGRWTFMSDASGFGLGGLGANGGGKGGNGGYRSPAVRQPTAGSNNQYRTNCTNINVGGITYSDTGWSTYGGGGGASTRAVGGQGKSYSNIPPARGFGAGGGGAGVHLSIFTSGDAGGFAVATIRW